MRDDNQLRLVRARQLDQSLAGQSRRAVSGDSLHRADSLGLDRCLAGFRLGFPRMGTKRLAGTAPLGSAGRRALVHTSVLQSLVLLLCLLALWSASGCSLAVMAGKMLMGDPKVPSLFRQRTGVDLIKADKRVLLVCTTPAFVKAENSALDRDIIEGVYRHFRRQDIPCVNPNEVDSWLGRIGGIWDDPSEIAQEFKTDYIIHFDIEAVSYIEPNSPGFYRGNTQGEVRVYEVRGKNEKRGAFLIFQHEFQSRYPNMYPVSADNMTERTFAEQYNKRVAEELARLFYDAPASDQVY